MPYPNEHSCRLHDPDGYEEGSFRRIRREDLAIVIGRPKGKETTQAQAYRYPVKKWTEDRARAHCKEAGGRFEPASKEEKAMSTDISADGAWGAGSTDNNAQTTTLSGGISAVEVDGVEVAVEELVAAYKAQQEQTQEREEAGPSPAVKMLREEDGGAVVGGHLLLWGSAERKDLQADYFTPETELMLEHYKSAPALFHHGLDEAVGLAVLGHRVKAEPDAVGVWVEDWLDTSNKYWKFVEPLLEAEVLFYSPGSAPHLVKQAEDGRLLSYPVVEDTLTVVPAQHRLRSVEQIKAAYTAAGLKLPEGLEPAEPEGNEDAAGAACPEAMEGLARAEMVLVEIEST